jgi:tRNA threonylcarbamoyladenosine biosynthesis protein TsaE
MKEFITNNFEATQEMGSNFSQWLLSREDFKKKALAIAFEGDLGAGKTTFVQGMAKGLGIKEQITSPTFVLMKKYKISISHSRSAIRYFYHFDCYRIDKAWQISELGFDEIISNPKNIVAIEWPENISEILPEDKTVIKFEGIDENRRKIIFE